MFPTLPGLSFRLLGFPVTIGLDFLIMALLFGAVPGVSGSLVIWLVVVTGSILLHELGHAYVLRAYGTHPSIRLWGLGGLTLSGFPLPARKQILVSLAGPAVGITLGIVLQILLPWLPASPLVNAAVGSLIFVNLGWGILNLLPIVGLDGGAIVQNGFALALGARGRTPGLVVVAVCSVVIAVGSVLVDFAYLAVLVLIFAIMNPGPYQELWRLVQPSRAGRTIGRWTDASEGYSPERTRDRGRVDVVAEPIDDGPPRRDRMTAVRQAAEGDVRRHYAAVYAETFPTAGADVDEIERRPEPLLADVSGMLARREASAAAGRLAREDDPLGALGIVARIVDARQVKGVAAALRREDAGLREAGLLKLQAALHSLGRFDEAVEVGQELARTTPQSASSAILLARSAARRGNRALAAESLGRVARLGGGPLSEAALADVARLGPDPRVAEQLTRLRGTKTT